MRTLLATVAILGAFVAPSVASAAIRTVDLTATVDSVSNIAGVGVNDTFTITLTYDDVAILATGPAFNASLDEAAANGGLSISFTIPGTSFAFTSGSFDIGGLDATQTTAEVTGQALIPFFTGLTFNASQDSSGDVLVDISNSVLSFTSFNSLNPALSQTLEATITLPAVAEIPEPATWAMMLLGFGLVAYRLNAGRKAAVA